MERLILTAGLAACFLVGPALANETDTDVKVERSETSKEQKQTLRFLRENRDFLRSQLDRLRQIQVERDGVLATLSDRHLMFQQMLKDILAAQDTTNEQQLKVEQLALLESVRQLGDLEAELDSIEGLLNDQSDRLSRLEQDFVGRQQTALLVMLRGYPDTDGPQALTLETDDGARLRIALGAKEQEALARGGIAQIYHELIEPRRQTLAVYLEGPGFGSDPQLVEVEPDRDRLNFVQLDLSALSADAEVSHASVTRWAK